MGIGGPILMEDTPVHQTGHHKSHIKVESQDIRKVTRLDKVHEHPKNGKNKQKQQQLPSTLTSFFFTHSLVSEGTRKRIRRWLQYRKQKRRRKRKGKKE